MALLVKGEINELHSYENSSLATNNLQHCLNMKTLQCIDQHKTADILYKVKDSWKIEFESLIGSIESDISTNCSMWFLYTYLLR